MKAALLIAAICLGGRCHQEKAAYFREWPYTETVEFPEPLAVLADRKGWWLARARHFPDRWVLNFDCETLDIWTKCEELAKPIVAPTYAAAEAAARKYLEGLEDKGGTI